MADNFDDYRPVSISGMVNGFTGMMSYYALIGVLLGLFACCVGGPLAVARLLGGDEDSSSSRIHYDEDSGSSRAHYKANDNTPGWLRPYVGSYSRHGQALDIAPDGRGEFRSRTYTYCDDDPQEPCEKVPGDMPLRTAFTVVRNGDGVVARADEGDVPIRLVKPGILDFGGDTYCESDVASPNDPGAEACGA